MTIKHFARSLLILVAALVGSPGFAQTNPNQGPGGPILVITNGNQNFGKFYAEILRTEGFNEFAVAEIGSVSATTLNSYDVVILAKVAVTSTQASMFSTWVNAGGNLIAMDPAPQLASLAGITQTASTLSNGYLRIDNSTKSGVGIAGETLQFHGTAQLSTLSGATSLATLYANASSATANPAVTLRSVGASGGQVAAFMFDLATSVVYTRQGNPAWAGQERDGVTPRRSDDMFFGNSASDPQADWIDLNKVATPQADEQQRFLANLITEVNADRKPLPRFWYLPNMHSAAVVMTGDDHGNNGTTGRFNQFIGASQPGCSLDNWECIRGTSYIFPSTPITDAQVAAFEASGFEISLHLNTQCEDYTAASLATTYSDQLADFRAKFPSAPALKTERHHCIVWSDWASGAKVELANGIRLDTSYYYWPAGWVQNVPGHFTGSAMPMRFADLDGSLIDVYQAVTQMTDESGQEYPFTVDMLLDRATGPEEQYGVYTINAHTDASVENESDTTLVSAQERGVPIITARQMLSWLDGRNSSSFGALSWSANTLNFSVNQAAGANGLQGMLPWRSGNQIVNSVKRNGVDLTYEVKTVKGVEYATFPASSGSYAASYLTDTAAPTVVSRTPTPGSSGVAISTQIRATFSEMVDPASVTPQSVELRDATNTLVPATATYNVASQSIRLVPTAPLLNSATYSVIIHGGLTDPRVKDPAGNALAANDTWSFSTAAPPACPCTIWPITAAPSGAFDADSVPVELGVKFRSDVSGYIKGIRFYKGPNNTGVHTGSLWSSAGQLLANATFSNESSGGWQQVLFSTPVAVTANTTYVASYFAPTGGYATTNSQFAAAGVDNGILHALSSPAASGNGVFAYGNGGEFPVSSWQGSNYWVDVVFDTVGGSPSDSTPPTITITSPLDASDYDASTSPLAIGGSAADNIGLTQVTWSNDRGGSGTAAGTVAWSVGAVPLQPGVNTITVTARDFSNNVGVDTLRVTYIAPPDSTPPSISSRTPAPGATGVAAGTSPISITFSEAMDLATINSSSLELRNAANALVPSTVAYNLVSFTATITPSSALAANTTYSVTVKGGAADPRVKDVAGNALTANATWSFTTSVATNSIWPNTAIPTVPSDSENSAVEVGLKFRSDVAGFITGVRFYKGAANTGSHVGHLWTSSGQQLGTVSFAGETATGWQQAAFATPIAIDANTTYVVSYLAPNGGYAADGNYFQTNGVDNGVLHALSGPATGGNGVYLYGASGGFPNQTYASTNYWVDVQFTQNVGPDTTAPTVTGRTPVPGAINIAANTPVTVVFNEPLDPASVSGSSIELRNALNALVPASVSYSGNTATLVPTASLATSSTYTVTVRGGGADPRVKDVAGNALAANDSWSFTTAAPGGPCAANTITAENCLTGNPASEWDISGAGDATIQGFATQISVNRGGSVSFKVDTNATNYRFDIYRLGYYGGLGARKIATFNPSASLPQNQPDCLTQPATGLIDCGNWAVSGSWTVPANAVSGVYIAKIVRADTGGASHIAFIVRNDASTSDLVFQTSDTTWQAYNTYGGNSLYVGSPGTNPGRAYKVSYNRPFITRGTSGGQDWLFNAEYPMIRWLESNGYDVSYISGVDTDRAANLLTGHRAFVSTGHDEYWSGQQRANVEAARDAGLNLAFFSGNEVFWKTRWENSIDGANTAYRTLVSYKETHASAKIDPSAEWTGTWRDPRFSPPANGGRPENALTGTIFTVNSGTAAIVVPAAEGKMRFWRGTSIAALAAGQSATLPDGVLGYEWDSDLDNGFRPSGLMRLSDTTVSGVDKIQDYGSTYATDTANHALTLYKASSGARVFGAGTIQWAWGLDANHDRGGTTTDIRMQQATVNLFADMNVQPATLQGTLTAAAPSSDTLAPTVLITSPANGAGIAQNAQTISGTATDSGGGQVGGVEVSVDGGNTWRAATGRASWTYNWTPATTGSTVIRVRAVDDSGNLQATPTQISVTVSAASCPCSIWPSITPTSAPDADPNSVELGTRFRSSTAGFITGIRFFKAAQNTGTHVGSLWSSTGTLLGQVTFTGESASGWQTATLPSRVAITANTWYVVSYHTNSGFYNGEDGYFATSAVVSGPLRAPQDGEAGAGANGLYRYASSSVFPTDTYQSENYWADVVFDNAGNPLPDSTPPAVSITAPTSAATMTATTTPLSIGGAASDDVGVTQVTWSNSRGGSGTAAGTTAWTASGIVLQSGSNILTVTARDAAGNTITDTLTVTFTPPDTTAPVVTITAPTSNATTTTSVTPLTIGGTASDAVGVTQITWSNNRGGSGTAAGTTSWSVTGVVLQTGANVLTVTALDAAGNSSSDAITVTYTPDTTAPAVVITSPTSASSTTVTASSLALGGTASDSVGVTQVTWSNDRGGSGTASGTTNWSVSAIALQSGVNVLTVTARDAAGNTSGDSISVTYTPDTTLPAVTITGPTSNTTLTVTTSPLSLSGTASDNVGVTQVSWSNNRGGSGNATGTTSWSVSSITLQSGANILTVTARDAAGNTSTDTLTVTYNPDVTQPAVTITSPTSNATLTVTTSPMTLGGTASDNIAVTQVSWTNSRGGSGTATGTTSWTTGNVTLQSGSNTLTVTARDAAGNTRTDVLTVTYTPDTTQPSVTITAPTSNTTLAVTASTMTLGGTASDNIGVTQVTWTNNRGGSGTATGTTSWTTGNVTLLSGSNTLTVTARDAAGNTRTDVLTVTYTPPDTTPPTITILLPTSNTTLATTSATVTLSGSASDTVGVTQVTWSNGAGGSGTATGTTTWTVPTVSLVIGANVLTVTARDAAGNTSTDTLTVTRN
jgi:Domain of unknown function (DUF4082)/Bacterial Ig-like domain/Bacterial Ig domain